MDEFEIPADLSTLSDEELTNLHEQVVTAFDAVYDSDDRSSLQDIGAAVLAIRTETEARAEKAAAEAQVAAELHAQIHGGPEDEEATEEEAPAEGEEVEASEPEAELVTASVKPTRFKVPASKVREAAPAPDVPSDHTGSIVVTAAANVPGVPAGQRFGSLSEVAKGMHGVARSLPVAHGNGQFATVASIEVPVDDRFIIGEGTSEDEAREILRAATSPEVLVASGGWCAPSTPIYDLFSIEESDGLLDLPSMRMDRGGVIFPVSPSLADVFGDPGAPWLWTEADDIAAAGGSPTKPCFTIPCPTFEEERLACEGMCLTHGNLSDMAYPELTRRWVDLFMSAHLHLMSGRRITTIITGSTAVAPTVFDGAAGQVLGSLDLAVADYRDRFRMGNGAVLEVLLPRWVRNLIRADLAQRQGVDLISVTDSAIQAYMADRGVIVQWLSDFDPMGGAVAATAFPSTARFIIYAAGTWALGRGKSIDLGVVRDSTLNATNDFTAAWSEECFTVFKPGHLSRIYTVPVCPNGATNPGDAANFVCAP